MNTALLAARFLVAAFLAFAAVAKLSDRDTFALHLYRNRLIPRRFVYPTVWLLPPLELLLAWWLATGVAGREAGVAVSALLAFFTLIFTVNWAISGETSCGCIGSVSAKRPVTMTIGRNLFLTILSGAIAARGTSCCPSADRMVAVLVAAAALIVMISVEELSGAEGHPSGAMSR